MKNNDATEYFLGYFIIFLMVGTGVFLYLKYYGDPFIPPKDTSQDQTVVKNENKNQPVISENKIDQTSLLNLKQKCAQDGELFYKNIQSQMTVSYIWQTPEYHYSSELNTCLAYIGYVTFNSSNYSLSSHYDQVYDIYANKILFYGWFDRDVSTNPYTEKLSDTYDSTVPNYASGGFLQRKDALFSQ